jgi:hypothetical protein
MINARIEMALTPAEFERQLQPVLDGWLVEALADGWQLRQDACAVSICCKPLPVRCLGLLEFPSLEVEFRFSGCDEARQMQFLQRFERYFRRGGG